MSAPHRIGWSNDSKWRNFDAIRLAAATSVVLSHCFLLSSAGYEREPFVQLLGFRNDLGLVSVGVFFVISGFLITRSFQHRATTLSYLLSRVCRILPGLVVCTLFTAFVIGPLFSASPGAYLADPEVWSYVFDTVLLQPGGGTGFPVALYPGNQGTVMLGTTWSLPSEFACYVGVLLLGSVRLLRLPAALLLLAVGVWSHTEWAWAMLAATAWTLMFFAAGSALHFIHEARRPTRTALVVAAVGLVAAGVAGHPLQGLAVFGSVLVIQLATTTRITLPDVARHGDLSYGVYLYGWPMQQLVRALWGPSITWWAMFALAMPLALGAAWLSWRLIESPALDVAKRYRLSQIAKVTAAPGAPGAAVAATA